MINLKEGNHFYRTLARLVHRESTSCVCVCFFKFSINGGGSWHILFHDILNTNEKFAIFEITIITASYINGNSHEAVIAKQKLHIFITRGGASFGRNAIFNGIFIRSGQDSFLTA